MLSLIKSLILALCLSSVAYAEVSPKVVRMGIIPGEDPKKMAKNGQELVKILSQRLGVKVELYQSKNYQDLIDAMKNKKVDFAWYTAMSFVFAEKEAGAKVLLKKVWEGPFYYSALVVKSDSGIQSLADLKGKSIAFVDEKSTSGYLYPRVALKKAGITSNDFKMELAGNHQASAKALVDGKVQVAAMYANGKNTERTALDEYFPKESSKYKRLWTSDPIPNDPFCVRQDFYDQYPQFSHKMMFAFLDLKEDPKENILKRLLGINEVMMATSRQYDPVREMVKELDLKL